MVPRVRFETLGFGVTRLRRGRLNLVPLWIDRAGAPLRSAASHRLKKSLPEAAHDYRALLVFDRRAIGRLAVTAVAQLHVNDGVEV